MEIEERLLSNLVFGLAETSPIFVVDGMVYSSSERKTSSNIFGIGNNKLYLVRNISIENLEKMSRDNDLEGLICSYKKNFINDKLKHKGYSVRSDYEELVKFTVEKIFPCLRKKESRKLSNLLGQQESDQEESDHETYSKYEFSLEKFFQDLKTSLERSFHGQEAPRDKIDDIIFKNEQLESRPCNSVFLELMNGYNFSIYNSAVYTLVPQMNGALKIDRKSYSLVQEYSLQDFKKMFLNKMLRMISIEATDDALKDKNFIQTNAKQDFFRKICDKGQYEEEDFGFNKISDRCIFVYTNVQSHVLKSPHNGRLYKFEGHKLGIDVGINEKKDIYLIKRPHAREDVKGPFYSDSSELCMGPDYHSSYLIDAGKSCGMTKGEAFAKYLVDARKVVLYGYDHYNITPHKRINSGDFGYNEISDGAVQELGLSITNLDYIETNVGINYDYEESSRESSRSRSYDSDDSN